MDWGEIGGGLGVRLGVDWGALGVDWGALGVDWG